MWIVVEVCKYIFLICFKRKSLEPAATDCNDYKLLNYGAMSKMSYFYFTTTLLN